MAGDADEHDPDCCPNCGALVGDLRDQRGLQRGGCRHCGLQVVRRPGEPWRGIRG
jgi:hypothetical protein